MKRIFTLLSFLFASFVTLAQWTTSGTNIYNSNAGNVGVGVTSPGAKLEVVSNGAWSLHVGVVGNRSNTFTQLQSSVASIAENSSDVAFNGAVAWDFFNNGTSPSWAGTYMAHVGTAVTGTQYGVPSANQGTLVFQNVSNGVIGTNGANLFMSPGGAVSTSFLANGNVGIGTSDTKGYKFAVNGSAIFTSAVVKLYGNWPDYVFKKNYNLTSLGNLEDFIKKNEHLPGLPSAAEMQESGKIDLGDMNVKLLEKIEELTLYMIELKKENVEMKKQITKLENK